MAKKERNPIQYYNKDYSYLQHLKIYASYRHKNLCLLKDFILII